MSIKNPNIVHVLCVSLPGKSRRRLALVVSMLFVCVGCSSTDPLTKKLNAIQYVAAAPAPANLQISNIYRHNNIRQPVIRLSDALSSTEIETLMAESKSDVSLGDSSGTKQWKIDAKADVITKIKAQLEAEGASTYSIKFGNAREFKLSEFVWLRKTGPALYEKMSEPPGFYQDTYVIIGLLQVDSLEYGFFRENGAKIEVSPGSDFTEKLTGSLGAGWSATGNNTLTFDQSRFIGYRLARVKESDIQRFSSQFADQPSNTKFDALDRAEMMQVIATE